MEPKKQTHDSKDEERESNEWSPIHSKHVGIAIIFRIATPLAGQ